MDAAEDECVAAADVRDRLNAGRAGCGVAGGNRNRDIAERLFISEETVKVHMRHIMEKLRARDRTAAVTTAMRRGILRF